MRAIVFESDANIRLVDVPTPTPDNQEVLIQVGACGICGSDLHIAEIKDFELPYPYIPGHEVAGTVIEMGRGVNGIELGDHVVVQPLLHCGACSACRKGYVNLCRSAEVIGLHRSGGFAQYLTAPAANTYVSTGLPSMVAACTEPLACALHGLARLAPRTGDRVIVFGAGSIGLLFLQLIRRSGAGHITVVDLHPHRLEAAHRLGADRTLVADGSEESILEQTDPRGFDCVVDATGVPEVVDAAFRCVAPAGKLLMLGSCPTDASISVHPRRIQSRDATVVGAIGFAFDFLPALQLLEEGHVSVDAIVTHSYGLDQFGQAIEQARSGGEGIKVQITPT